MKGLPPLIRNNAEELERIRENFALVSKLHHPYIAAALHLQLAREVAYASEDVREKLRVMPGDTLMVMEYAPGVTLSKWRRQFPGGKVPLDLALQIAWQIAQALDYAHEQHIIHRDIKPSNIMVETKPDGEVVARLLDFGLAAEIRSSMGRVSREVRDTSGTRPYMAPEQWAGRKQGPATDQYAHAVLLCELLTGEVPFASVFETGDPIVMMMAACNRAVELPGDCPRQAALRRALAKDPLQRFEGCMRFIEVAAKSEPMQKPNPSTKPKGKLAHVVLGIAASILILAVGSGLWYRHHQKIRQLEQARIAAMQKAEVGCLDREKIERKAKGKNVTERLKLEEGEVVVLARRLSPGTCIETVSETVTNTVIVTNTVTKVVEVEHAGTPVAALEYIDRRVECSIPPGMLKVRFEVKLEKDAPHAQLQLIFQDAAGKTRGDERWTVKKTKKGTLKVPAGAVKAILSAGRVSGDRPTVFSYFKLSTDP